jgi:ABC-type branched-subunit amino acid transport system ATPase component
MPVVSAENDAGVAPAIELDGVTKRFATPGGEPYTALRDLDLTVARGEFCAIVGPTGCGKSTTLSLVSGLERPSAGVVRVDGQEVAGITGGLGFMFQTDAILPWKTVLDNVAPGRASGARRSGPRRPRPGTGSAGWAWPASRTGSRTSSPAACVSASRSPRTSSTSRASC